MKALLALAVLALTALAAVAALLLGACSPSRPAPVSPGPETDGAGEAEGPRVRVALFNVLELGAEKLAEVDAAGVGRNGQLRAAAEIVQRVRPDVLVVQEIDYPYGEPEPAANARAFAVRYLATGDAPIDYPYVFTAPVNTGLLSGFDLNGDGRVATEADLGERAYGDDSLGWGTYPGQYGMAVLSRFPLAAEEARTFQRFPWRDLPGNHLPPGFYSEEELAVLPLSSKSHWDVPVRVPEAAQVEGEGERRLHLWVSHPTPPVFDGPEDRNGRRNFDEIRFWKLYAEGSPALVDDAGRSGGRDAGEPFVVVGDLNADPQGENGVYDGIQAARQLLDHPDMVDAGELLTSEGGRGVVRVGADRLEESHPERSTAAFDRGMRLDHLIPGGGAVPVAGGVFWPAAEEDPRGHDLAETASDHRLVWLDLVLR